MSGNNCQNEHSFEEAIFIPEASCSLRWVYKCFELSTETNATKRSLTLSGKLTKTSFLTVSIPIQNFATILLGFAEPIILIKRKQGLLVEV